MEAGASTRLKGTVSRAKKPPARPVAVAVDFSLGDDAPVADAKAPLNAEISSVLDRPPETQATKERKPHAAKQTLTSEPAALVVEAPANASDIKSRLVELGRVLHSIEWLDRMRCPIASQTSHTLEWKPLAWATLDKVPESYALKSIPCTTIPFE
jgi:hypothetical protein